jgi:hypothetical protein
MQQAGGMTTELVNRKRELDELEWALADAHGGHGRLVLIAGEAGIGKTRLTEEIAQRGRSKGMEDVWGRAWESGGAPAYWPWVQILRSLISSRDDEALRAQLGVGAPWIAQIVPELTERLPKLEPPRSLASDKARFALFDAVSVFLRKAASDQTLVVVLEDVHAADHDSVVLLEFVGRAISDVPILGLVTYQEAPARRRPEVEKVLGALSHEATTIVLRGFREEDVGRIAELRTGRPLHPDVVRSLHATTEGNPFFASEVVRLLGAEGRLDNPPESHGLPRFPLPQSVRETVRRRLEPLNPRAIQTLAAAAVIGREFRVTTLARALEPSEGLIELVGEAEAAGLVAEAPGAAGRFRFTHNLIRDALYMDLSAADRIRLHRVVGEVLEQTYGGSAEHLAELAHHFAAASPAGDPEKALEYATKAAAEAMRLFAYEQAADLYRLAIDTSELLPPDPLRRTILLLALGHARARADHLGAKETLVAAAAAAREAGETKLMADAALTIRAFPQGAGVLDEQPGALLNEVLERLHEGDSPLRARVLARLGVALYYWPGTDHRRHALAEDSVAMARRLGDASTLIHVLSNAQLATWSPYETERDLEWMGEALTLIEQTGDHELELSVRSRRIDLLIELDDLASAAGELDDLARTDVDGSEPRAGPYVSLNRARLAVLEGRFGEAERHNAAGASGGSRLRDPIISGLARTQLFSMRWIQGRLGDQEEAMRQAVRSDATPAWPAGLAVAHCQAGHPDEARRLLEQLAVNDFRELKRYNGTLVTQALLAQVCAHLGDARRAGLLYEQLLPFAGRMVTTPTAIFAGPVEHFLGILARTRSEFATAAGHFGEARATGKRIGSPPVLMAVALEEARMLADRDEPGDRERVIELLDEAAAIAEELDLELIVSLVGQQRQALGVHAAGATPEPAHAPLAAATPAEMRREGDVWVFHFDRRAVRVRDSKGLRCLAVLLANPGIEVHAAELARPDGSSVSGTASSAGAAEAGLGTISGDDAGPVLDGQAKAAYRRRLEELREEIEEAESFNDPERAAHAREDMDFLTGELAGAVGLGGRDRKTGSSSERARVSVTKAIRGTIRRISKLDAGLGRELDTTIRTGIFCTHEPDPRRPLAWRVKED